MFKASRLKCRKAIDTGPVTGTGVCSIDPEPKDCITLYHAFLFISSTNMFKFKQALYMGMVHQPLL